MISKIDFESTILALFDELSLLIGIFLGSMMILGQKACFLGPAIFEIFTTELILIFISQLEISKVLNEQTAENQHRCRGPK